MSRFNNVKVLLDTAEDYNLKRLTEVLQSYELDELDELAEDIAFVLISMWALVSPVSQQVFKERLTDEMVNFEIERMFPDGDV